MNDRVLAIRNMLCDGEAALITSDASRFYITGFRSSAGVVFITRRRAVFLIDFRYYEKAKSTVKHLETELSVRLFEQLSKLIAEEKIQNVLVETDRLSVAEFSNYSRLLSASLSDDDKLTNTLKKLRQIKSKYETECIKIAQKYTDSTFAYILGRIECGKSERDIMLDMEFFMRKQGSEGVAFDFIVVSGKNSSLPHGTPTDKLIENGDFITMDFGAVYNGYCSDMTRTVAVGNVSDEMKTVYNTVLTAQNKAFELIRPDAVCVEIDKAARDYIYSCGYEGCFGHGLGHSVGVEIHESPAFNTRCDTRLEQGMIMTVEPGIYLENKFGVRIEDMVYITDEGFDNLTHSPKDLIII